MNSFRLILVFVVALSIDEVGANRREQQYKARYRRRESAGLGPEWAPHCFGAYRCAVTPTACMPPCSCSWADSSHCIVHSRMNRAIVSAPPSQRATTRAQTLRSYSVSGLEGPLMLGCSRSPSRRFSAIRHGLCSLRKSLLTMIMPTWQVAGITFTPRSDALRKCLHAHLPEFFIAYFMTDGRSGVGARHYTNVLVGAV